MCEVVFYRHRPDGKAQWVRCQGLVGTVRAVRAEEVMPALEAVEAATSRGLYAAGFLAYEAAAGLDSHLAVRDHCPVPLAWFGFFREMVPTDQPPEVEESQVSAAPVEGRFRVGPWQPSVSYEQYCQAIGRIREYIASGDTYQANYTFRLRADFAGRPWAMFQQMCAAQAAQHCAYVDTGRHAICSASPELFFSLAGGLLTSRPMKGTAPRGLTSAADRLAGAALARSAKNRAENAMIVDMVRNDIGRIAQFDSIQVTNAFALERFPTLWQMTTTVSGRVSASLPRIIEAIFPCASITGAPKIRTMQIIRELEDSPRGLYTGAIGYVGPGGNAEFNVAIRTAVVDRTRGQVEYGVGGGIIWDSRAEDEYAECLTKAAVLTARPVDFELLETLLWEAPDGYFLLEEHLGRLADSAGYFDFAIDLNDLRQRLLDAAAAFGTGARRVRLRVDRRGQIVIEDAPLDTWPLPRRLVMARRPIDKDQPWLYHKTTRREVYAAAAADKGDCDDVILYNRQGQITETTTANLVVDLDGKLVTPPVECGLLPGVFRSYLLKTGQIREAVITLDDIRRAERLFAVNSVRRWMPAVWVEP